MRHRWRGALLLATALALGAGLRLATYRQVMGSGTANPLSPDCFYHLRRARFATAQFPRTILFDPLINFPAGGICIWPPLFDVVLAMPALLSRGPHASPCSIENLAMWVPLAFAAGAIAAAAIAGSAARRRSGAAAALFVALCPGHIHYSQFGNTDQHVAESCWGYLALAFFLRAAASDAPAAEWLAGGFLAAAVLTWQGAIFWAALFGAALLATVRSWRNPFRTAVLVLGAPAAVVAAATALWTGGAKLPMTYVSFGPFQPFFLATAFGVTMLGIAIRGPRTPVRPGRAAGAALGTAALLPSLLAGRAFWGPTAEGIAHLVTRSAGSGIVAGGFLSYSRRWLAQISEYRPLFADGLRLPAELLSLAIFLAPVAIFLWIARAGRGQRRAVHAALAVWASFTLLTVVFQRRDMYYAALLAALAGIEIARSATAHLLRRRPSLRRAARPALISAAILLVLGLPMAWGISHESGARYSAGDDLLATLSGLKREARSRLDPYDARLLFAPASVPGLSRAESVLAPWSLGHAITYETGLPVVADNFGYGFDDSIRFFLASDESEAMAIVRSHRVRWVLCADLAPKLDDYAKILRLPPLIESGPAGARVLPAYFHTMQSRLYDFDGGAIRLPGVTPIPPLEHFRLVYASRTGHVRFGRFDSQWKVFEVR